MDINSGFYDLERILETGFYQGGRWDEIKMYRLPFKNFLCNSKY